VGATIVTGPALGRRLGSGKAAEVFDCGTAVMKLYRSGVPKRSAFREAAALALVETLGLPVPQVLGVRRVGDRWGVRITRAEGPSFADVMRAKPEGVPDYLKAMARLHFRVHGLGWPDATRGDSSADVCRSFVLIRPVAPEVAAAYVETYADVGGETRERVYRWLPFVAAARLAEGVLDEEEGLLEIVGSRWRA
jgi:hypothetical protein